MDIFTIICMVDTDQQVTVVTFEKLSPRPLYRTDAYASMLTASQRFAHSPPPKTAGAPAFPPLAIAPSLPRPRPGLERREHGDGAARRFSHNLFPLRALALPARPRWHRIWRVSSHPGQRAKDLSTHQADHLSLERPPAILRPSAVVWWRSCKVQIITAKRHGFSSDTRPRAGVASCTLWRRCAEGESAQTHPGCTTQAPERGRGVFARHRRRPRPHTLSLAVATCVHSGASGVSRGSNALPARSASWRSALVSCLLGGGHTTHSPTGPSTKTREELGGSLS